MRLALALSSLLAIARASLYDPHVPEGNPWFEGWYTRISKTSSGISFGIIVGHYPDTLSLQNPSAYVALIVDGGQGPVQTFQSYPKKLQVLANGVLPIQNPSESGEPNFSVIDEAGHKIELIQSGSEQKLRMEFAEEKVTFEARLAEPEPWDNHKGGPEGWAGRLPFLGLHWFVYSLHSTVSLEFKSPSFGTVIDTGSAHQEKNWGTAFPETWFWAQAIGHNARFALAGGAALVGPVTVPNSFLVGLRSGNKTWDFHPQDPTLFSLTGNGCEGTLSLKGETLFRELKVEVHTAFTDAGLFKAAGPTRTGFQSLSVESYRANIVVEVWKRSIFAKELEAREIFTNAAIEFGGTGRCHVGSRLRRVRRELRTLSAEERERVFAAMDVMKQTPGDIGRQQFGSRFTSYDELVAQHLKASAQKPCDAAHLGPAFAMYHRAFTMQFEESLLSIDSSIGALPYWDYNIEAAMEDPRKSELWTWFGSSEGDASKDHRVTDGRFGHWRVRSMASDISNLTNGHGLLRSPWNVNPSPYITRYRYSCGSETAFNTKIWELCLMSPLYMGWYACIDPMVHTWAHSFIGGIWNTTFNSSRIACYVENAMAVPNLWNFGCFICDTSCQGDSSCSCEKSPDWRCIEDKFYPGQKTPIYGDFADAWASPNDPIFFFHHANVDRSLMTWQQRHRNQAPHYNFPTVSVPCKGHGLHDVVAPEVPFKSSLLGLADEDRLLTNAELLSADGLSDTSMYTYDSLDDGLIFV